MLAAVLNTLIPLRLGDLVNTVAHLPPGVSLHSYLSLLMPSALTLVLFYVAQVSTVDQFLTWLIFCVCDVLCPECVYVWVYQCPLNCW